MGETEQRILKECYAWKRKVPDVILNAPELRLGLEFYFSAFLALNTCRSLGWSPGPIPYNSVAEYAQLYELDEEETEDLHYHIRRMDAAFLEVGSKKAKES
jgi:hypothetical protein